MKKFLVFLTIFVLSSQYLISNEVKIIASDGDVNDNFGYSVSISGDYAVAGAYYDADRGDYAGSAFIFVRDDSSWTEQQKLLGADLTTGDQFGRSVSISGDYAIIGAQGGDDGGSNAGAAYIYVRSGNTWTQQQKIVASDPMASAFFGQAVSISGDYAIIGAYGDANYSGSAYIFVNNSGTWTQQQKLVGGSRNYFGNSVSISGNYVIVGAERDDAAGSTSGSAYIFVNNSGTWSQQQKLVASDGAAVDRFGYSVSISGDYAIAGAYNDNDAGDNSGSAYIFVNNSGTWTQQQKIVDSDGAAGDQFGCSVSMSGVIAMVGSLGNDSSGSAHIYIYSSGLWIQQQNLVASDAALGDQFGRSVSISGHYAIVGAPDDDGAGGNAYGAAYIYIPHNPRIHVDASGDDESSIGLESNPFRSIQAAINYAENGDTVLVFPGTYVENINFNGKNIVVGSLILTSQDTSYISQTIIDGNQSGSVVTINSSETIDAKLVGLTIANGSGNIFPDNGELYGGGLYIEDASPIIDNCSIINNESVLGAGAFVYHSNAIFFECQFLGNSTFDPFDGDQHSCIWNGWSGAQYYNCLVADNNAIGIYSYGSSGVWNNIKVLRNQNRGAIFSNEDISDCTFDSNVGLGVSLSGTGLRNCVISRNTGVGVNASSVQLDNCTIVDNGEWGIYCYNSQPTINESIIDNNLGGNIELFGTALIDLTYSNVSDSLLPGLGNVSVDPKFVDKANGNYSLLASSLSINAGHPDSTDSDGSRADMGAYPYLNEYSGADWHVTTGGDDINGTGESSNPFASIQAGINFASDHDSVFVGPGTYTENVDFRGHSVSIKGVEGATNTIVDGNTSGSVFSATAQEDTSTSLEGLTIQNGTGTFVYINDSNQGTYGGGIYIHNSNLKILSCNLVNNHATYSGGGIGAFQALSIKVADCDIHENSAGQDGGGTMLSTNESEVINSRIWNNAAHNGGGIFSYGSDAILSNLEIHHNVANSQGGGLYQGNSITLSNSIIYLNQADYGGGINSRGDGPTLINNTIVLNSATESGGGVMTSDSSPGLSLINSIVYFNDAPNGSQIHAWQETTPLVQFSNVEGWSNDNGNFSIDPLFIDAPGANFHLPASSFCINAGHPDSLDSDGSRADIGALPYINEYSGPDWYVEIDGDDVSGTGEQTNPFASIQSGINFSEITDSIKVNAGTYYEHVDFRGKNVHLFGLNGSNSTIIDGSNSGRPITMHNQTQTSQSLSGLTLQNGSEYTGAGIYAIRSNAFLKDLQVVSNTSSYQGGGIYSEYSNLNISDVLLAGNSANNGGAGLLIYESSLVGDNIVAYENTSTENGGFIHLYTSSASFNHTTIVDNAALNGPVVYSRVNSSVEMINSILWNNTESPFFQDTDSTITISYSDVEGGFGGSHNLNINPWFVDLESHSYNLSDNSGCLGAGYDTTFIASADIDGNSRPNPAGSSPDMGAYESPLAEPVVIVEIQNLDIGDEEELQHLLTHIPDVSFTYYNSLEEPLTHYQMQVSTLADFSAIDMWDTYTVIGSDTIVTYAGNALQDGGEYYLRVKGTSGDFWTDWTTLSFRLNSIPQPPILVSPIENSVVGDELLFTLQNSTDNELDDLMYHFSLYEDMAMTTLVDGSELIPEGVDVTTWASTSELSDNNQYWWTSRVFDGFEYSTVSDPASFLVNTENSPPETFELIFPLVDMELSTLTPSFSWHTALDIDPDDVVSYSLYLDTPEPGVQVYELGSDTLFMPPSPLLDNTTYFWRVVAVDILGMETENITGYQSFTINTSNDLPVVFDLLYPVSDEMVTNLQPEFLWEASSDPDDGVIALREAGKGKLSEDKSTGNNSVAVITGYDFYLSTDSLLTDAVSVEVAGTSYSPTENLLENQIYYWAVSAIDDDGGITFSDTASFWTNAANDLPAPFSMLEPVGMPLLELTSLTPTFTWSPSTDADLNDELIYRINLGTSTWDMAEVYAGPDTSWNPPESLWDNTVYSWEVIAEDLSGATTTAGIGDSVAFAHFHTNMENDNPEPAVLLSPDSVVVLTDTPTFIWERSFDPDPFESIEYEVHWWYEGSEWDSIITEETSVAISNPLTVDNLQYFWQVISMDDQNGIAQSEDYMFWVDFLPEPPGTFALASPDDESAGNSTRPELTWQAAIDPDPFDNVHYQITIASDTLMADVVYEGVSIPEIHVPDVDLENDTRYYWQVSALDEDSLQTLSDVWTFDVGYLAIDDGLALPTEFVLDQNFPNPFNPSTTLRYGLPEDSEVSLVIYDIRGNTVRTIDSGSQVAGWYEHIWNGMDDSGQPVSTGLYLTRLRAGSYTKTIKMLYLK
jgi:hypothetical protein